jgi:hypothetical protein
MLTNKAKVALTQAGLDYQESNIDLKIQEYLEAFPSEDEGQVAGFIKATEIGVFVCSSMCCNNILSNIQYHLSLQ